MNILFLEIHPSKRLHLKMEIFAQNLAKLDISDIFLEKGGKSKIAAGSPVPEYLVYLVYLEYY